MINKLHGAFVAERLKAARTAAGGQISWSKVAEIIQHAHEDEFRQFTALNAAPKEPRKQPVPRKRNEFVDALALACGGNPQFMTPMALRAVGVAWSEIRSVSPECTPDEIHRRASRYKSLHPTWPCTASSLSKYWDQLGESLGRTHAAKIDSYVEPAGWMEKASRMYPEADFTGRTWADIPITVKNTIVQRA